MLMTIEKVLILKTTSMLCAVPDELLGEIARRSVEMSLAPGECLFTEGEIGSSMFIVVTGQLALHAASRPVGQLTASEVAGELDALDPAPRLATATACVPTTLLRITHHDLNMIMSADIDVARSFITILCGRLRHRRSTLDHPRQP
jgi:CRP/FNR family transcriptional regulator, cyclic AMP receptor protein